MHHGLFTKSWSLHVCSIHAPLCLLFMSNCLITICSYEYWENQSPPTEIQQKIPHKVPRTFYLSKRDTCCHARSTPGKIKRYNWVGETHSDSDEKHTPLHIRIHKQWNLYLLFPYASYSHKYHYLLAHKQYEKRYNTIRFIVLHSIILSYQSLTILGPDPHHPPKW